MSGIAIACSGLVKRHPGIVAVDGIDLEVHRGECFDMPGPNGAGKTTTIEMIRGLFRPDEGEIGSSSSRGSAIVPDAVRYRTPRVLSPLFPSWRPLDRSRGRT